MVAAPPESFESMASVWRPLQQVIQNVRNFLLGAFAKRLASRKIHQLHQGKLMTRSTEAFMRKENRQHRRRVVNWPVVIKTPKRSMKGETRDVSSGGAFIYCEKPQTPKQIFYLTIQIHPKIVSFTSMAEAVWFTPYGMGVRLHPELPEQHQLLSKFISDA